MPTECRADRMLSAFFDRVTSCSTRCWPDFYTQQILAEVVLGMGCYAVYARTAAWRAAGLGNGAWIVGCALTRVCRD